MTDEINPEIIDNSNPNTSAAFLGNPSVSPLDVQKLAVQEVQAQIIRNNQQRAINAYRGQQWFTKMEQQIGSVNDDHQNETMGYLKKMEDIGTSIYLKGGDPSFPGDPANQQNGLNQKDVLDAHNQIMDLAVQAAQNTARRKGLQADQAKQAQDIMEGIKSGQITQQQADDAAAKNAAITAAGKGVGGSQAAWDKFYGAPTKDADGNITGGGYGGVLLTPKPFDPVNNENILLNKPNGQYAYQTFTETKNGQTWQSKQRPADSIGDYASDVLSNPESMNYYKKQIANLSPSDLTELQSRAMDNPYILNKYPIPDSAEAMANQMVQNKHDRDFNTPIPIAYKDESANWNYKISQTDYNNWKMANGIGASPDKTYSTIDPKTGAVMDVTPTKDPSKEKEVIDKQEYDFYPVEGVTLTETKHGDQTGTIEPVKGTQPIFNKDGSVTITRKSGDPNDKNPVQQTVFVDLNKFLVSPQYKALKAENTPEANAKILAIEKTIPLNAASIPGGQKEIDKFYGQNTTPSATPAAPTSNGRPPLSSFIK